MIHHDDKRQIPEVGSAIWSERISETKKHYCKYCYEETNTFILVEGWIDSTRAEQHLRCCWGCGSGLQILTKSEQRALGL